MNRLFLNMGERGGRATPSPMGCGGGSRGQPDSSSVFKERGGGVSATERGRCGSSLYPPLPMELRGGWRVLSLGSCTMKYNPKVNEEIARWKGFASLHPYTPEELCQGVLQIMYEMEKVLAEVTGMDRVSLQPAAGAHGELTGS